MNTKSPLPFRTTEPVLALCLRLIGIPMWVPPMNVYDEPILQRLGYHGKLRDAARAADRDKERGRVEYYFEKTPELDYLLKIFQEQEKEINEAGNDRDVSERVKEIIALSTRPPEDRPDIHGPLMDEREMAVRLFCIAFKLRPKFLFQWQEWTSWLEITKDAREPEKISSEVTRFHPGLNRVPVNASDETLRKLNLIA